MVQCSYRQVSKNGQFFVVILNKRQLTQVVAEDADETAGNFADCR